MIPITERVEQYLRQRETLGTGLSASAGDVLRSFAVFATDTGAGSRDVQAEHVVHVDRSGAASSAADSARSRKSRGLLASRFAGMAQREGAMATWLFAWTEVGAERVGVVQRLLATCTLQGVDPYTYLVDVLQRVGRHPASRAVELTPRVWKTLFADDPLRSDLDRGRDPPGS